MGRSTFASGRPIVWRSRPGGAIGYVFGCRVLLDEPDALAVVQPTGAPVRRRLAALGGPNGRSLLPGTWTGAYRATTWGGLTSVRLHPVGRAYSVIRTWIDAEARYRGWYVNLEQPWVRTAVGFDSRDDILDIVARDDLSGCRLKDDDELEFAGDVGQLAPAEAASIRATAEAAIDDVGHRRWPFDEAAWTDLRPATDDRPLVLPADWDQA
jgi:hypothetical protein